LFVLFQILPPEILEHEFATFERLILSRICDFGETCCDFFMTIIKVNAFDLKRFVGRNWLPVHNRQVFIYSFCFLADV